jgi:hypothetical protein
MGLEPRNNNGPKTVPWGTPESTVAVNDLTPSKSQVVCGHVRMSRFIAVCCCECHSSLACLTAKLFADDCLLYREVNTKSDTNKLQEDLDMLQSGKANGKWLLMQINVLS